MLFVKARLTSGGILVQAPPFVSQSLSRPQQGVDRVKQKLQQTRLGHHEVLNSVVCTVSCLQAFYTLFAFVCVQKLTCVLHTACVLIKQSYGRFDK